MNVPIERQRLLFKGKMLIDSESLLENKIETNQVIQLIANRVANLPRDEEDSSEANDNEGTEGLDLSGLILNALREQAHHRRNRRMGFQRIARRLLDDTSLNLR